MLEFLEQDSIQVDISGNAPLLLDKPEYIYLVSSESVDVFATPMQDGQPHGVRTFLFRAGKGSLLCGLDPEGYGSGLGLIVTGKPGSAALQASRAKLEQASQDQDPAVCKQVRELIQGWIANLILSLDQGIPPKETILLEPGSHVLQPGVHAKIKSEYKQLWIRHLQGSSLFCSQSDWQLSDQAGYLPFSEKAWITANEETHLECLTQEQYQAMDTGYQLLENFHRLFLNFVLQQQIWSEQEEKSRLEEMAKKDQARLSSTMSLLAEAMEMKQEGLTQEAAAGDELLAACKRVGQEIGLDIQEPSSEAKINTDPLQAIAKSSNFRIRQVALKGEWWESDGGPMLGFLNDAQSGEERPVALIQPSAGSYILEDIRTGTKRKVGKEVNEELSFFAYSFYSPLPNRPLKALDLLRFGFFRLRRDQAMLLLMAIFAALLGLLPPIANGIIFDTMIPEADRSGLLFLGAILVSAAIATGFFEVVKAYSTMRVVGKVDLRLQSGVMDRLLSLPTPFFRDYTAGDLAERTLGINAIREILSGATLSSMMGGIFSSFSLALLFYYSWKLALVALVITLIAVLIVGWIGYSQVRYQRT
ncbi:MAG: ABC transporter transmembrane domain-containing protein, partial [Desulfohalobiaceae bacterium]